MRIRTELLRILVLAAGVLVILSPRRTARAYPEGCAEWVATVTYCGGARCSASYDTWTEGGPGRDLLDKSTAVCTAAPCLGKDVDYPETDDLYCCGESGDPCASDIDCCAEYVCSNNVCATPPPTCRANGASCSSGSQCCSGICDPLLGKCAPCLSNGNACSAPCCYICINGKCCSSGLGGGCSTARDCCTIGAECPSGTCCLPAGMTGCTGDDCCPPYVCQDGTCECPMGTPVAVGSVGPFWR